MNINNNCQENFLDSIGSIQVIPDEAISFYYPLTERKKVLDASYFEADYQRSFFLNTKKRSIGVSEGLSTALAGKVYEVKVSWVVEAVNEAAAADAVAQFERLESGINHLLLRTIDDHRYLLRVHADAWQFSYIEKDGRYECSFVAQSACGLQRIPMD